MKKALRISLIVLLFFLLISCNLLIPKKANLEKTIVPVPTETTTAMPPSPLENGPDFGNNSGGPQNINTIYNGETVILNSWKVADDGKSIIIKTNKGDITAYSWFLHLWTVHMDIHEFDTDKSISNELGPNFFLSEDPYDYPKEGSFDGLKVKLWVRDATWAVGRIREAVAVEYYEPTEKDKGIDNLWQKTNLHIDPFNLGGDNFFPVGECQFMRIMLSMSQDIGVQAKDVNKACQDVPEQFPIKPTLDPGNLKSI